MKLRPRHRATTVSPSNSMVVPYSDRRLTIPTGWAVEQVPRRDGSRSDLYYREPGSRRKFRSITEVHNYLNGGTPKKRIAPSPSNYKPRRMIVYDGKLWKMNGELSHDNLAIVASRRPIRNAPIILPDGWIVEEVRRRYEEFSDRYYYEPETGQKFRSLIAVERYLAEEDENENAPLSKTLEEIRENKPLAKIFKLDHQTKVYTKKKKSQENTPASSFSTPPMKVNWVLASSQGDVWNPFIAQNQVPDAVKQEWINRFMIFMKDGASNFSSSQA